MATKKNNVAKKPAANKVVKDVAKSAKKPVKAAVKGKKAPMVPTVDTFKKISNGKLKAVAPTAKPSAIKTIAVVIKVAKNCPCKAKKESPKKSAKKAAPKKPVASKPKSKKTK